MSKRFKCQGGSYVKEVDKMIHSWNIQRGDCLKVRRFKEVHMSRRLTRQYDPFFLFDCS